LYAITFSYEQYFTIQITLTRGLLEVQTYVNVMLPTCKWSTKWYKFVCKRMTYFIQRLTLL